MIVDTISAEDIGKLPDDSIADALTTLPGACGASRLLVRTLGNRSCIPVEHTWLERGLHQYAVQRTRIGQYLRFPCRAVRPVPGRIDQCGDRVQDAGCGLDRPRPGRLTVDFENPASARFPETNRAIQGDGTAFFDRPGSGRGKSQWRPFIGILYRPICQSHGRCVAGICTPGRPCSRSTASQLGLRLTVRTQAPGFPNAISSQGDEFWANSSSNVRDGVMGVLQWKPTKDFSTVVDAFLFQV